jgi:hypothetical protein
MRGLPGGKPPNREREKPRLRRRLALPLARSIQRIALQPQKRLVPEP